MYILVRSNVKEDKTNIKIIGIFRTCKGVRKVYNRLQHTIKKDERLQVIRKAFFTTEIFWRAIEIHIQKRRNRKFKRLSQKYNKLGRRLAVMRNERM